MQVKEFLNKIRHIDMMIDCKCSQIKDLRDSLTIISCPMGGEKVQSTKDPDKFTDPVSKIIELEQEINEDIDKLIDLKRVARKLIEQLDNEVEKMILYKRYFENKTFEQISVEMNYSWRQVHRLHGSALQNFSKIYKMS